MKKLFSGLLGLFAFLSMGISNPLYADHTEISCFEFDSDTQTITDYYDHENNNPLHPACPRDVEVSPSAIANGKKAKIIGIKAFYNKNLTSVVTPDNITTIKREAFENNKIQNLTLGSGVETLGEKAFYENKIRTLSIPHNIITFGEEVFHHNDIEDLTIDMEEIPNGAFKNFRSIERLTLSDNVKKIGEAAFRDNEIREINIPNSVEEIGNYAFNTNQIHTLTIGNNIKTIGEEVFSRNKLREVHIPDGVEEIGDYAFNINQIHTLTIGTHVKTIGEDSFSNNQIATLTLGNALEEIKNRAFLSNKIQTLTIPDSVKIIGDQTFSDNEIETVSLGNSLESIGRFGFSQNKLQKINIPDSLNSVGTWAFKSNAANEVIGKVTWDPTDPANQAKKEALEGTNAGNDTYLKLIQIGSCFNFDAATKTIIEYYEHEDDDANNPACPKDVVIPAQINGLTVEYIGDGAFQNKNLTSVILPNTIKKISSWGFYDNQIQTLTIPDSVQHIYPYAFAENNIETLTLGNSVETISSFAFLKSDIQTLTIPDSVTDIGEGAFQTNKIQTLNLGNNIKYIGKAGFYNNKLSEVTLPDSVTEVKENAFKKNTTDPVIGKVTWDPTDPVNTQKKEDIEGTVADGDVSYLKLEQTVSNTSCFNFDPATKTIIKYYEHEDDDANNPACPKDVVIPAQINGINVEVIGPSSFDSKNITSVVLPNTVKTIGNQAFYDNQIQALTIPDSVKIIDKFAFDENDIETLTLGNSVETISDFAFGKSDIQTLTIPNSVEEIGDYAFNTNKIHTLTIGSHVKTIGERAFAVNRLSEVTLPDSLIKVKKNAFRQNTANPVIGKVTWDLADAANAQKKEDIEGTAADDDVSFLKLEQVGTERKIGIKFDLDGGNPPTNQPNFYDDRETVNAYDNGDEIPASEFTFIQTSGPTIPTKDGYILWVWNWETYRADDTVKRTSSLWIPNGGSVPNLDPEEAYIKFTVDWQRSLASIEPINGLDIEMPINTTEADAIAALPAKGKIKDTAGNEYEVDLAWTLEYVDEFGASLPYVGDSPVINYATATFDLPNGMVDAHQFPLERKYEGTVTIIDGNAPTLTLNGANPQTIVKGNPYVELGATATDVEDDDATLTVVIDASNVDINMVGTYNVNYSVTDSDGNTVTKDRTVKVVNSGGGNQGGNSGGQSSGPGGGYNQQIVIIDDDLNNNMQAGGIVKPKDEMQQAYEWSYTRGITTMNTLEKARVHDTITRAELAKMISVYAVKELKKKKRNNTIPKYTDTQNIHGDLKDYITLSYQLGLMGRNPDGTPLKNFHPNSQVTRAEFATVLSRLLYGDKYENLKGHFYTKHIQALKDNAILTNTTPNMKEKRGWIMLMLMRSQKK